MVRAIIIILSLMVILACGYVNKERAVEFYDKHVKNFPEVQQMKTPRFLNEGEKLPYNNNEWNEMIYRAVKIIICLLFYILPAFVAGEAAKKRGYEKTWYLFTLFAIAFTPIMGFLAVIAFPPKVNYIKVIK